MVDRKKTKKTKGRKHLTQKQKQHVSQRVVVNVSVPQRKPPRKMGYNPPKKAKPSMTSFYGEPWHLQRPASNVYDSLFRNLDSKHKDTDRGSKRAFQGIDALTSGQRNEMSTQTVEATSPPAAPLEATVKPNPIVETIVEPLEEHGSSSVSPIPAHESTPPPSNRLGSSPSVQSAPPKKSTTKRRNLESRITDDSEQELSSVESPYDRLAGTHKYRKNNKVDWAGQGPAIQAFLGGEGNKSVQQTQNGYNNYKARSRPPLID